MQKLSSLIGLLFLSGCTSIYPSYERPVVNIQTEWYSTQLASSNMDERLESLKNWWAMFDDQALNQFILLGNQNNPNVLIAYERMEQLNTVKAQAFSKYMPTVGAGYTDTKSGEPQAGVDETRSKTSMIQFGWEIDLFGRVAKENDAAKARLRAASFSWHDARISLNSDIATLYFQVRLMSDTLVNLEQDLTSRKATLALMQHKEKAGFVPSVEVSRLESSILEVENQLVSTKANIELLTNQLSLLTGVNITQTHKILSDNTFKFVLPKIKEAPIPASLIDARPDVLAAERNLESTVHDLGVAYASNLPVVKLSGFIGTTLFGAMGVVTKLQPWQIAGAITLPVFEGGAGVARVDYAQSKFKEAEVQYRYKVQQAVKDVEDSLIRIQSASQRRVNSDTSVQKMARYSNAVQLKYEKGMASLVDFEEAKRNLLSIRINKNTADLDYLTAWISLYRAIGGGWTNEE